MSRSVLVPARGLAAEGAHPAFVPRYEQLGHAAPYRDEDELVVRMVDPQVAALPRSWKLCHLAHALLVRDDFRGVHPLQSHEAHQDGPPFLQEALATAQAYCLRWSEIRIYRQFF